MNWHEGLEKGGAEGCGAAEPRQPTRMEPLSRGYGGPRHKPGQPGLPSLAGSGALLKAHATLLGLSYGYDDLIN